MAAVPLPAPAVISFVGDGDYDWLNRLLGVVLVVVVAVAAYRAYRFLLGRLVAREQARPDPTMLNTQVLARRKRRETARTVFEQSGKYLIAIIAVFFALGQVFDSTTFGVAGASLLAVVLGFASQTLLKDVIAGVFIVFEGQYGVGDYVALWPMGSEGIVEDLGLRSTTLRNLNGDRIHVPNGFIQSATLPERGFRAYTVDCLTHEPDVLGARITAMLSSMERDLYVTAPRLLETVRVDDRTFVRRVDCVVVPSMEWLVEKVLVSRLAEEGDDLLVTEPIAYTIDTQRLRQYERWLLVR